ncbi:glycylpeptide N-tetradecanoyltransferase-like [Toxorhynchites rutilus septentrionalis]|uniref:glycylpeptide N-tetradecanoyltransferase-like n=1 Tax=Toxorhynchites rutilus septentrionalis TaxID=329112 RepID=UPI0024799151|nr:glycylpeptide N-tetradecanoyltransferase-like [Toxorhynchites rutilus septentrionalis]
MDSFRLPVAFSHYWYRYMNPKKLVEIKFYHLSRNMTMQRTTKLYKLPDDTKTFGFQKIREADLKETYRLLERYLAGFHLTPAFDEDKFRHWFLPQESIIDCFVVEKRLFQ